MTTTENKELTHAWSRLVRAKHSILSSVETTLKQAGLPPLVWYDVLLELNRDTAAGLRPSEIENRMLLPQYGISRLLDRIEKAGYIQHKKCMNDGRGKRILITSSGKKLLKQMWPIYHQTLEEKISNNITNREIIQLSGILEKLYSNDS